MCPELLKKLISKKTKAVLCENFFGEIAKISEIKKICKKNNLHLIEDISDVIGLKNQSNKIGKHGDVSICNFSIDKVITSGEGGAILTDEKKIYLKAKNLIESKTNNKRESSNSNLYFTPSNLQSAMIYGQFKRLNELIQIKKTIMNNYKKNLMGLNIKLKGVTNIILEFDKKHKIKPNVIIKYLNKNKIQAKRLPSPFNLKKNYYKKKLYFYKKTLSKFNCTTI